MVYKICVFFMFFTISQPTFAFDMESIGMIKPVKGIGNQFIGKINSVYNNIRPDIESIRPETVVSTANTSVLNMLNGIRNNMASVYLNLPKTGSEISPFLNSRLQSTVNSVTVTLSPSITRVFKPFNDFVDFIKNLIYSKPQTASVSSCSAWPANKNVTSPYGNSPFGVSGAYSRPFIASDNASREEVHKKIVSSADPYKDAKDIGAKWVRPGTDITWQLVQHSKEDVINGSFDWSETDKLYGEVPDGINTLATISAGQGMKEGTWQFIDKEVERAYINYVNAVVERYDGDGKKDMPGLTNPIKYWQVGNEPFINAQALVKKDEKQIINSDWEGFKQVREITCKAIREADPQAVIAVGGIAAGDAVNTDKNLYHRQIEGFYKPLLSNSKNNNILDVHYYGVPLNNDTGWKGMKKIYAIMTQIINGEAQDNKIWFTETAVSDSYGEKAQAIELIKRFIYPVSFGAEKIFWWNMIEGEYPLEDNQPSDHYGLVYDGIGQDDPGYGVKKLSFYTYKKMVQILEGSDWNETQTINENEGIYIYKFKRSGKSIWVAWNEGIGEKEVLIQGINSSLVKITEAVPRYQSGGDINDYQQAFNTKTSPVINNNVTVRLGSVPVFIEN